jgi:hypothetical protein
MEKIVYIKDDETPDNTGWWIVLFDDDGYSYDSFGPYETEEEATRIAREYPLGE